MGSQRVGHDWATKQHQTSSIATTILLISVQLSLVCFLLPLTNFCFMVWENAAPNFKFILYRSTSRAGITSHYSYKRGFPIGSDSKESACNVRDPGSVPGWGGSSGEGSGYPLQYSCLENAMDRGGQLATVLGIPKNQTWLSSWHTHTYI